jgi:hypothetical protein
MIRLRDASDGWVPDVSNGEPVSVDPAGLESAIFRPLRAPIFREKLRSILQLKTRPLSNRMGLRHQTLSKHPACEMQSYTKVDGIAHNSIEEYTKIANNIIHNKRGPSDPNKFRPKGLK